MKTHKRRMCLWSMVSAVIILLSLNCAFAQIVPMGDTYINSAAPTTNYGTSTTVAVNGASEITYIQFNLASVPSGYTGANVQKATLKLYVNAVTTAGNFNVDYVNGAWTENTIDASNAPPPGSTIAASVPVTKSQVHDFVLIDVTSALQAWLNGTEANDGIALVANGSFNATFDSKENTSQSHPAELDVVYAGPGTITGVQTGSGSGLQGGGTSGTLNLSLLTSCAANQILSWNGSSWVCSSPGTGTVTSVGSGLGLLGGPITTSGTLSVDTTKVPLLSAPNTFTASQTVSGNLSATGLVTGSGFQIGANLFGYGSFLAGNAFLGFSGNATISGGNNTATGYQAEQNLTSGGSNSGFGEYALRSNTSGNWNAGLGASAGATADGQLTSGSNNTFLGALSNAGGANETTVSNSTAIGSNAQVNQSNAMVLGSINGVNGATADTAVGIGTTTPVIAPLAGNPPTKLNIVGNNTYVPLVLQSPNNFGTWMVLNNTSTGGKPWAILSAASGNTEGAGNLGITDFGAGGTIFLEGNVNVTGNLSKGGGSFKIDHPIDPANKYLYHSFVESPDMMNIYNGNVVTDKHGVATVELPDWFEALNRDFRYQLTVVGQFAQAMVVKKVEKNHFSIKTNKPGVEVSWQVTGIRQDAYANAYRIPVEEVKPPQEQGHYLHPELFGAGSERSTNADMHQAFPATVTQAAVQSPAIN